MPSDPTLRPDGVRVVHVDEDPPAAWSAAVYLCGPTPTDPRETSWRPAAVAALRERWTGGGTLAVFVPEPSPGGHYPAYADQIGWEEEAMRLSDVVVFWIPRDMARLPGLVSNIKWGTWCGSGRAVLGAPPAAERMEYLLHFADALAVPVARTVEETVRVALDRVGTGVPRAGGERAVPLPVWRTGPFRRWYGERTAAGDRLLDARVEWFGGAGAQAGAEAAEWLLTVTVAPADGAAPAVTRLLAAQGQGMLM
ncbi:nucleoside 2-deoxyribosyltransferase domain-containing protein [Streptomyces sp. NPDC090022]|uniref:nucleoside 2-deoxyribosyltransferase domain-containing protein n=1 Tax=Streptomyces sp. NPDC090022 TaxID=3365920 RepID=UPI00380C7800